MNKTFALVGEPNVGKTTLFNSLTGLKAKTGNWHGVTVTAQIGKLLCDSEVSLIDLPGITLLDSQEFSGEEKCTAQYIIANGFTSADIDLFINVITPDNIHSGLYLTLQLLELNLPFIICINPIHSQQLKVDLRKLHKYFGCEVIESRELKGYLQSLITPASSSCLSACGGCTSKSFCNISKTNSSPPSLSNSLNKSMNQGIFMKKALSESNPFSALYNRQSRAIYSVSAKAIIFAIYGEWGRELYNNLTAYPSLWHRLYYLEHGHDRYFDMLKDYKMLSVHAKQFKSSQAEKIISSLTPQDEYKEQAQIPSVYVTDSINTNVITKTSSDAISNNKMQAVNDQSNIALEANLSETKCLLKAQEDIGLVISKLRYDYINRAMKDCLSKSPIKTNNKAKILDAIFLHQGFALPIFILLIYIIFHLTINLGGYFKPLFEQGANLVIITPLVNLLSSLPINANIIHIVQNGLGAGIQTIASFIPLLFLMYLSLGILEESGYMTRATVVMDKLFNRLNLPGKAIIPLIIGFGCNVPAIVSTKALANTNQRIGVIMMLPFISCGARLAVFALFADIFFTAYKSLTIWLLYMTGIILAILTSKIFKDYLTHGLYSSITVLPQYKVPNLTKVLSYSFSRVIDFIKGASKTIIIISLLLNILGSFNARGFTNNMGDSILATYSKKFTWLLEPIGLSENNWQASVSLITGIFAKEVIVGSLASLYDISNIEAKNEEQPAKSEQVKLDPFQERISESFSSEGAAFSYMLFILLYFPCVSVFAVIAREIGMKYAILSVSWSTFSAYCLASIFYNAYLYTHSIILSLIIALGIIVGLITLTKAGLKACIITPYRAKV